MMTIPNELYFIQILMRAFESKDVRSSMGKAFREIEQLGTRPEYADGYQQFAAFITAGAHATAPEIRNNALTSILFALASDIFEGPDDVKSLLMEKITANPELKTRYEQIVQDINISEEKPPIALELERDNEIIHTMEFSDDEREHRISGIVPGQYRLSLSNGRVLWESTITSQDALWEEAFPGENYTMAADMGDEELKVSRIEELLDGEVYLTLLPGLESGILVITVKQV